MNGSFMELLHRPRKLAARLIDADERLEEMWAVCTKMSTSFESTGSHGSGGGDAKDGPLAAFAQMVSDTEYCRKRMREAEQELTNFLFRLRLENNAYSRRDSMILLERYLNRNDWDTVMDLLLKNGYHCTSLRTVFNWHRSAIERAEKLWEEINDKNTGDDASDS